MTPNALHDCIKVTTRVKKPARWKTLKWPLHNPRLNSFFLRNWSKNCYYGKKSQKMQILKILIKRLLEHILIFVFTKKKNIIMRLLLSTKKFRIVEPRSSSLIHRMSLLCSLQAVVNFEILTKNDSTATINRVRINRT